MAELSKALILAKMTGATLIIAKLDRLSRNAAFLLTLRDSGVRLLAVDMPAANDLSVGTIALVEQAEREAIFRRTKDALAVSKALGVKLGNHNGATALRRTGRALWRSVRRSWPTPSLTRRIWRYWRQTFGLDWRQACGQWRSS